MSYEYGKYETKEQAYDAGVEAGRVEAESAGTKQDEGLTFEQIQSMSAEEHIARKDEVNKALEGGLVRPAQEQGE